MNPGYITEPNVEAIPAELVGRDQWLLWDKSADRKQPFTLAGDRLVPASWTDPDDWLSFEAALAAVDDNDPVGLGFVFANTNGEYARGVYGGLDLDGVIAEVGTEDWLPDLDPFLERDAYVERSPSGEGLHIPLAGFEPPEWWTDVHKSADEHEGVEAYGSKYFTFTGDRIDGAGTEVVDHGDWVEDWLAAAYERLTGEDPREAHTTAPDLPDDAPSESYNDEYLTREDIEDALGHISGPLDYPTWRNIGWAIADFFDSTATAKRVFVDFSRGKPNWDADAKERATRIIEDDDGRQSGSGVGVGTLIYHAKRGGWEPPSPAKTMRDVPDSDAVDSEDLDLEDETPLDKQAWEEWSQRRLDGDLTAESEVPLLALKYIARAHTRYDTSQIPKNATELPAMAHNRALGWLNDEWADQQNVDTVEVNDDERVTTTNYVSRTSGPTCSWADVRYVYDESKEEGRLAAVQLFRRQYDFLTPEDTEELHMYRADSGIYEPGARFDVGRELDRNLKSHYSTHEKNEILNRLRERTLERKELEAGRFDGTHVCVENGVLDVDERELLDHDPKWLFTRRLPVAYNPDADAPEIRAFLEDITRRREDWLTMVEMVGHALLPHYRYEAFQVLFGRGANGKSTWYNVVREFLGTDNVENINLQKLTDRDFAASNLLGQWANIGEDLPATKINDMGMLKDLTGGGMTWVEPKGKQGFNMQNRATMMFAANEPPVLGERSHAVARRILPIRLPHRYTAADDEHKDRDDEIEDRLVTDAELSGLLNLALEGIDRLRRNQDFSLPEGPQERLEYYEQFSDHIKMFAVNCVANESGAQERKTDIYNAYTHFCEEKGRTPVGKQTFWRQIRKTTLDISIARPKLENGDRPRVAENLTFTPHGQQFAPNYERAVDAATISAIAPEDEGVTIEGRVESVDTDQPDALAEKAVVVDETDEVTVAVWDDANKPSLEEGQAYRFKQVDVQTYDGEREVHVSEYSGIEAISAGVGNVPAEDPGDNAQLDAAADGGQADGDAGPQDLESVKPKVVMAVREHEDDSADPVPHELVVGSLVTDGLDPDRVEHGIDAALQDGAIQEPVDDAYRST